MATYPHWIPTKIRNLKQRKGRQPQVNLANERRRILSRRSRALTFPVISETLSAPWRELGLPHHWSSWAQLQHVLSLSAKFKIKEWEILVRFICLCETSGIISPPIRSTCADIFLNPRASSSSETSRTSFGSWTSAQKNQTSTQSTRPYCATSYTYAGWSPHSYILNGYLWYSGRTWLLKQLSLEGFPS